jgi:hypothetical protein
LFQRKGPPTKERSADQGNAKTTTPITSHLLTSTTTKEHGEDEHVKFDGTEINGEDDQLSGDDDDSTVGEHVSAPPTAKVMAPSTPGSVVQSRESVVVATGGIFTGVADSR